ncbi:MAG: hypothetical protein ACLUSP_02955 [Christensenellales bacterium]
MNLDALLTYQKADLAYKKLNDEIKKNQNYVEMRSNKKKFEAAKNAVLESEKQAENIVSSYEQGLKFIEQCAGEIEDLCAKLENGDADEETERSLVVRLEELQASVNEWKKRVDGLKALADKALGDYKAAQVSGKIPRRLRRRKSEVRSFPEGQGSGTQKLKDARDALAGAVDPTLMETYLKLTGDGVYPAFAPATELDKNMSCGVCGMVVSSSAKTDLENKGYCRCETCRRIIYKL